MKRVAVLLALVSLVLLACAPKAAPGPAATPSAVSTPSPRSDQQVAAPTAEEAAWAKVVAEARKEGKVTMYSFGFTGDMAKELIRAFESAHGIKMEIVGGVGAVLMERLKSERAAGKPIADTYDSAPSFLLTARAEGLTSPADYLPEVNRSVKWRLKPLEPEKVMYPYYLSIGTSYVNTNLVKPGDEPKSYKDLLQPQWKGKIAIAPPSLDPTGLYPYVAWKKYGRTDVDDYYRQLGKQDLKVMPTVRDVIGSVVRGENAVAFVTTPGIANVFIAQGAPIKPLVMEEGQVLTWGATIAVTKNAPHPNAARVLINWLMTAEGQAAANRARGAMPIREDVEDFSPEKARIDIKKPLALEVPDLIEMSRLQREKTVDRIMGLDVK